MKIAASESLDELAAERAFRAAAVGPSRTSA
jgi:hypothetical protein